MSYSISLKIFRHSFYSISHSSIDLSWVPNAIYFKLGDIPTPIGSISEELWFTIVLHNLLKILVDSISHTKISPFSK